MRLFGTDGIRGVINDPLSVDLCYKLARALVMHFDLTHGETVIIGKDTRESGDIFEHALAASFASFGVDVLLAGVMPTPAIAIIAEKMQTLGVVISASHNPYYYNGIKVFNKFGLKLSDTDQLEIEKNIFGEKNIETTKIGRINPAEFRDYISKIEKVEIDGRGKKIVVDAANGAMSDIAPKIFKNLHFNTIVINAEPNGKNINENCGVTSPKTLSDAVVQNHADFGIAFDGDGDRVILCDENGDVMDGDQILALFSEDTQHEIVSTIMANFGLEKFLEEKGIRLIRTNVGDRYISDYMQKHTAEFGGEPSGHIIIRSHALTGDGLFSGLKVIEKYMRSEKKFSEFSHVFTPVPTINKNVKIADKKIMFRSDIDTMVKKYQIQLRDRGRLIVRPSGTEPVIRITAEGEDETELNSIVTNISDKLEGR